ncbi:MAG: hypothetical protein GVY18_08745 [Bacteroidetes bacterium]|nr:hypothetical protein [Bacteroidota bacterium]
MIRSRYLFPIALIALTLVACDSSPATAPPENVGEDVAAYLQALPGWAEFSPLESEQEPTPAGDPVEEEPVTLDVEKVDDDGSVYTEEDVVYACQTQPYTLSQNPEQIAMYSPDREILWAGALIQGKSHRDGLGSLLGLPIAERAPINVSIPSLANDDNFRRVDRPSQAEVDQAIGSMIGSATQSDLSTPSTIAFETQAYHSEQQAALQMDISGRYLGFEASASGSADRDASETTVTAQFYEKMYEVVVEPPQSPGDFFSTDFTQAKLQQQVDQGRIGPNNLPVYVSNIVYGRMMMFSMTSTASEEDIRATMQAGYESIGGGVEAKLDAKQRRILRESKIRVTSIGGDAEATLAVIRSGDWSRYFTENAELSSAAPLSYTFRNLGDGSIASVTEATEYNVRTCTARQATPGTFDLLEAQDLSLPLLTPVTTHVADVDGDGNDDLIWNHLSSTNDVAIAFANGDGTFAAPTTVRHPETAPEGNWDRYTLITGDPNGDGQADLIWNRTGDQNRTYVALSTGGAFDFLPGQLHPVSTPRNESWENGYRLLVGDMDGDGDDDLVWNALERLNFTYFGFSNGDGTFVMPTTAQGHIAGGLGYWTSYEAFLGDVNDDGMSDIVWNATTASDNRTWVGLFNPEYDTSLTPETTVDNYLEIKEPSQDRGFPGWEDYTTLAGNVDGTDGMDLVFIALGWSDVQVYRNLSRDDGQFAMPPQQHVDLDGATNTLFARLADVTANGRDDLIIYNQTLDKTHVGLSTPEGAFDFSRAPQTRPQQDDWSQFQLLVGDVNGDRRDDAIWVDASARNRVYVGLARASDAL